MKLNCIAAATICQPLWKWTAVILAGNQATFPGGYDGQSCTCGWSLAALLSTLLNCCRLRRPHRCWYPCPWSGVVTTGADVQFNIAASPTAISPSTIGGIGSCCCKRLPINVVPPYREQMQTIWPRWYIRCFLYLMCFTKAMITSDCFAVSISGSFIVANEHFHGEEYERYQRKGASSTWRRRVRWFDQVAKTNKLDKDIQKHSDHHFLF